MSVPDLPQEILDYATDFLHDERETLKQCCLVSKSWVPCARKHLFADIGFYRAMDLEMWKKTFSDPVDSPAHYTRSLLIVCPRSVVAADAEEGGWIRTFSRVVRLEMWSTTLGIRELSLVPFHNFSPVLKSLRVVSCSLPRSQIFDLVCSLPLLEDLGLVDNTSHQSDHNHFPPSTSPPLTGSLELYAYRMEHTVDRLLKLPGGLHFRKLALTWCFERNLRQIMALVTRCSDTIECFDISNSLPSRDPWPAFIDLSEMKNLEDVVFQCGTMHIRWIIAALETITSKHRGLKQISIYIPYYILASFDPASVRQNIGEETRREWVDLDRILVQFWESRAVRTKIVYVVETRRKEEVCGPLDDLLPEMTAGGITKLVVPRQ